MSAIVQMDTVDAMVFLIDNKPQVVNTTAEINSMQIHEIQ